MCGRGTGNTHGEPMNCDRTAVSGQCVRITCIVWDYDDGGFVGVYAREQMERGLTVKMSVSTASI